MTSDRAGGETRRRAGGGLWLLTCALACASTGGREGCRQDGESGPGPTSASGGDEGAEAGDEGAEGGDEGGGGAPSTATARAIDAELQGALRAVYGGVTRRGASAEASEAGVVHALIYALPRAHAERDGEALRRALAAAGFTIERALIDARAAAIFARGRGAGITVVVDVGAAQAEASIDEAR